MRIPRELPYAVLTMNLIRLLPSLAVALALFSAPALAQSSNASPAPAASAEPAPPAHAHHVNPMRTALATLDLSDAQKAQIQKLHEQAKAARVNGQPMSHAEMLKQLNAILTPAQRTQLQAALDKAKAAQQQPPAQQ
jgi:Spy/CpxP family protein refolding chaperone